MLVHCLSLPSACKQRSSPVCESLHWLIYTAGTSQAHTSKLLQAKIQSSQVSKQGELKSCITLDQSMGQNYLLCSLNSRAWEGLGMLQAWPPPQACFFLVHVYKWHRIFSGFTVTEYGLASSILELMLQTLPAMRNKLPVEMLKYQEFSGSRFLKHEFAFSRFQLQVCFLKAWFSFLQNLKMLQGRNNTKSYKK